MMYDCFIRISKIQFCFHYDATTATGNLHCVTLSIFMEHIGTFNFHEQSKLNVNETLGPVFAGNPAVSWPLQVVLSLSGNIITIAFD